MNGKNTKKPAARFDAGTMTVEIPFQGISTSFRAILMRIDNDPHETLVVAVEGIKSGTEHFDVITRILEYPHTETYLAGKYRLYVYAKALDKDESDADIVSFVVTDVMACLNNCHLMDSNCNVMTSDIATLKKEMKSLGEQLVAQDQVRVLFDKIEGRITAVEGEWSGRRKELADLAVRIQTTVNIINRPQQPQAPHNENSTKALTEDPNGVFEELVEKSLAEWAALRDGIKAEKASLIEDIRKGAGKMTTRVAGSCRKQVAQAIKEAAASATNTGTAMFKERIDEILADHRRQMAQIAEAFDALDARSKGLLGMQRHAQQSLNAITLIKDEADRISAILQNAEPVVSTALAKINAFEQELLEHQATLDAFEAEEKKKSAKRTAQWRRRMTSAKNEQKMLLARIGMECSEIIAQVSESCRQETARAIEAAALLVADTSNDLEERCVEWCAKIQRIEEDHRKVEQEMKKILDPLIQRYKDETEKIGLVLTELDGDKAKMRSLSDEMAAMLATMAQDRHHLLAEMRQGAETILRQAADAHQKELSNALEALKTLQDSTTTAVTEQIAAAERQMGAMEERSLRIEADLKQALMPIISRYEQEVGTLRFGLTELGVEKDEARRLNAELAARLQELTNERAGYAQQFATMIAQAQAAALKGRKKRTGTWVAIWLSFRTNKKVKGLERQVKRLQQAAATTNHPSSHTSWATLTANMRQLVVIGLMGLSILVILIAGIVRRDRPTTPGSGRPIATAVTGLPPEVAALKAPNADTVYPYICNTHTCK